MGLLLTSLSPCSCAAPAPKNVLFIVVDDMRPDLGAYNATIAHTPNMDRLTASGLLFSRAYVSAPATCTGAS